jgi:hypothetical protein
MEKHGIVEWLAEDRLQAAGIACKLQTKGTGSVVTQQILVPAFLCTEELRTHEIISPTWQIISLHIISDLVKFSDK